MLNNQYYTIYNDSLDIIYDSLTDLIITDKTNFIQNYTLYNNKKITDYMLFVRDFYKTQDFSKMEDINIKNKSKYISVLWKNLDPDKKKLYGIKAKKMLEYFKKNFKKEKPLIVKKRKNKKTIKKETYINTIKYNNVLEKYEIDNIEYYIDCNKNLISIENEVYIGYLDGEIVNLYH
jgi:hypothetical protein